MVLEKALACSSGKRWAMVLVLLLVLQSEKHLALEWVKVMVRVWQCTCCQGRLMLVHATSTRYCTRSSSFGRAHSTQSLSRSLYHLPRTCPTPYHIDVCPVCMDWKVLA